MQSYDPEWQAFSLNDLLRRAIANRLTVEKSTEQLNANTKFALVRSARRESPCCPGGHGALDGVVVAVPSDEGVDFLTEMGITRDDSARTILMFAVDEHKGREVQISLDVAALERHVNHCTEALAFVRRRNEEMAAAAAGSNA
jgi:hypothetical protein